MEISYTKDTYHTYMVIVGSGADETDDEEKMLSNQQSSALLPFHMQQLNGKKDYYYDITGRMDFKSYIEKQQADVIIIENVIHFLINTYHTVDEYLLSPDSILLDPACVYMDMDEKNLYAAYVPGMRDCFDRQLQWFSACLLENTDHRDKEGVLLAYEFYKTVRREDFAPGLLTALCKRESVAEEKVSAAIGNDLNHHMPMVDQNLSDEKSADPIKEKEENWKAKKAGFFF